MTLVAIWDDYASLSLVEVQSRDTLWDEIIGEVPPELWIAYQVAKQNVYALEERIQRIVKEQQVTE